MNERIIAFIQAVLTKIPFATASNLGRIEPDGVTTQRSTDGEISLKSVKTAEKAETATTAAAADKLGSATVGGTVKPVYIGNGGAPQALTGSAGGGAQPVYLAAGAFTKCSATVGAAKTPVYLSGGKIVSATAFANGAFLTNCASLNCSYNCY